MLTRRQQVGLVCAGIFVMVWAVLGLIYLADGAWVRGAIALVVAIAFGVGFSISVGRSRAT